MDQDPRPPWAPTPPERPASGLLGLRGAPGLTLHRLALPRWTLPALRVAVIADPHVCRPWLPAARLAAIVEQVNATEPDLIVLAGDYLADRKMPARGLPASAIVPHFARLRAPLGAHAILGNHDYADCRLARRTGGAQGSVRQAFDRLGNPLLVNENRCLEHRGARFWIVGLDSQQACGRGNPGREDPARAFAGVPPGAPCLLLAHEPDYFALGDPRPVLQISGHTHGGQGVLFGRRPMVPSKYGDRYALGHIVEEGRHLIVSAGLGYSGLPLRLGVPPEITLIDLHPAR